MYSDNGINCFFAIVVTYCPDANLIRHLNRILLEVDRIVIVDNTPETEVSEVSFDDFMGGNSSRVQRIWNRKNMGVGYAINKGIEYALKEGAEWIVTFDQDSSPEPGFRLALEAALISCTRSDEVGLWGADIPYIGQRVSVKMPGRVKPGFEVKTSVITAGTVMSARAYETIGPMREDFFIDYVDHEYSLRARSKGLRVVCVGDAKIEHRLGAMRAHRLLGLTICTTNHVAWRRYYMGRNRVRLWLGYWNKEPRWVCRDVLRVGSEVLKILVFERRRIKKISCLAGGVFDGIMGRTPPDFGSNI